MQALVAGHVRFLRSTATLDVHDLVSSLMEVAEGDDRVAYHLWVLIFPVIWASLSKDRQLSLAKPTINLISKFSEEVAQEAPPHDRRDGKRVSHMRACARSELAMPIDACDFTLIRQHFCVSGHVV
jgi:transformation/transcription domain-associated protein